MGPCTQSWAHNTSTFQAGDTALPAWEGGSKGTWPQGVTAPAATTHHEGKLRHGDFKHTTGQAWPCALPGTITSMTLRSTVPRDTVPRGVVPRGTQRNVNQKHNA